jgi:copper homeostasis protein CutC
MRWSKKDKRVVQIETQMTSRAAEELAITLSRALDEIRNLAVKPGLRQTTVSQPLT